MTRRDRVIATLFILFLLLTSFFSGEWSKWLQAIICVFVFLLLFLVWRNIPSRSSFSLKQLFCNPHTYLVLWIFVAVATVPFSTHWYQSASQVALLIAYGLAYYAAFIFFRSGRAITWLSHGIWGIGIITASIGLYMFVDQSAGRVGGLLFNANAISSLLLLVLPVSLIITFRWSKRWALYLSGLGLLILLAAFGLTYSYTAWVGFLLPLYLLARRYRTRVFTRRSALIFSLILVVAFLGIVGFRYSQSRDLGAAVQVHKVISYNHFITSFSQRLNFNQSTAEIFLDHPWIGTGLNTFQNMYGQYHHTIIEQPRYAHNYYIQTAAELGLIGVGGFIVFIVLAAKRIARAMREPEHGGDVALRYGLGLGILGSAIHALFDFGWQFPAVFLMFWVMLGALMAPRMSSVVTTESQNSKQRSTVAWRIGILVIALVLLGRGLSVFWGAYSFDAAQLHAERNEVFESLDAYEQGLRYDPDPGMLAEYAGLMVQKNNLLLDGQLSAMQTRVERALKYLPDNYLIHWTLGRVYFVQDEFAQAISQYQRAIELNPAFRPDLYYDLAYVYFVQEHYDEAVSTIRSLLSHYYIGVHTSNPYLPTQLAALHYLLGEVYSAQERFALAERYYEKSLWYDENFRPAQNALKRLNESTE